MRLTDTMRSAFVTAAMNDVPESNHIEKIEGLDGLFGGAYVEDAGEMGQIVRHGRCLSRIRKPVRRPGLGD